MGRRRLQSNALLLALCLSGALGSPSPAPTPDPEPGVAFYRGAVESSLRQETPSGTPDSSSTTADVEYGSKSLPLRSSVESVPLKSLRELEEQRVPLRDAVESRPDEQTLAALRAASSSQVSESSSQQTPLTDDTESKQYYGAASHFNENKKSDRLQQGNMNLEEMRQTATGAAERRLVVCYVQGWAAYRSPPLAFTAGLVPTSCTHLHYAFATLHPHSYTVTPTDHDYDVVRGGYRSVTGLRLSRPGLRVLLSVGGVGSERLLAEMASDHLRRAAFVESAVAFIKEYEFDGLDLHWAYPGETEPHDKEHLTALLYELREKFTPHDFTLSVILPSSRYLIEDGYDLSAVSGAADYAVVQAWDMHAENRNEPPRRAVHHSPLHVDPAATSTRESRFENIEFAVKYLLRRGMAKEKLVLGVPIFGRSFTLTNSAISKPGAFVSGWGDEGLYTQNRGLLAYFEICMAVREGRGSVRVDSAGNSYAVLGDQWVGFDNVQSIADKMRFAVRTGLAGGAAWAVDMDDFRGLCGDKWPLVTAMAQAINDQPVRPSESQLKTISFCERDSAYLSSDASSCAQFTLCSGGVEYRLSCEDNTLYDPTTGRCGHLDANRCVPGQSLRISIIEASKLILSQNIEGAVNQADTLETSQRVVKPSKYQPAAETPEESMAMDSIQMPEITTVSHELAASDSNTLENAFTNAHSLGPVSNEVPNEDTVFVENHPITHTSASSKQSEAQSPPLIHVEEHKEAIVIESESHKNIVEADNANAVPNDAATNEYMGSSIPDPNMMSVIKTAPDSQVKPLSEEYGVMQPSSSNFMPTDQEPTPTQSIIPVEHMINDSVMDEMHIFEPLINEIVDPPQANTALSDMTSHTSDKPNEPTNTDTISESQDILAIMEFDASSTQEQSMPAETTYNMSTDQDMTETDVDTSQAQPINIEGIESIDELPTTSNGELTAQGVSESELAPWDNEDHVAGSDIEQAVSEGKASSDMVSKARWYFAYGADDFKIDTRTDSSSNDIPIIEGTSVSYEPETLVDLPSDDDGKQNDKRVVCYMTNWAFYRRGEGKFVPEHVDTRLCTHLVYAYATLTPDTLMAKEFDPWTDIDNNLFERVTSLKDLKVLLGLGGWTESAGDKYSRLVSSGAARRTFISNLIALLRQHHFSGVHLDWNYPVCWQSDCKKGPATDKANFAKLIQELSSELHAAGMEVGVAVSGYKEIIERAYDLRSLSASADFLSAMTYDYHGGWETTVAHPTPLSARTGDSLPAYSIEYAIKALISGGANPKKLLLGLSFYGQTYRLEEVEGTAVPGTAASGPGEPGEFTKQPGMMAYYEICYRMKNLRWQSGRQSNAGPYAYSRDQWVGFDDQQSIKEKVEWGLRQGLGGVTAWTVDLDDFSNRCCAEPSPLLRAANRALGRSTPAPPTAACARPPAPVTPAPPTTTTVDDMGGGGSHHNHGQGSATTWPSWSPGGTSTSTPSTAQTWWPTPASTTSTTRAPTTTTRAPTTTTRAPTTVSPTTTIAATTVTLPPPVSSDGTMENGKCDGKTGDYHAAAGDCDSYLQCVAGVWRKQRCAPGLHWSAKHNRCDWPSSAKCIMMQNEQPSWSATSTLAPTTARPPRPTPTTTTTSTTTAPAPLPPSTAEPASEPAGDSDAVMEDERCEGMAGDYHGAAGECESYLQCVAGVWHKHRCAPGLHWNSASSRCDWPAAAKCTGGDKAPMTPAPTTTTTSTTKAPPPPPLQDELPVAILKPGSPCQTGTYHAHPRCSKFFICVNGALVAQSCAPGLQWNSERSMCDFPAQAACVERKAPAPGKDQAERDRPSTPAPTPSSDSSAPSADSPAPSADSPAPSADSPASAAIVEQPMPMSSCSDGSYSSYPGDCGRYRHCLWGKYEEFRCSAGLHWNQEKQICDWPKHAHCKEGDASSLDEDTLHVSDTQPAPADPPPPPSYEPAPTVEPSTLKPTTTTLTIIDKPDIVKSPYKLVCYFTNWAWYRPGLGKYVPEDIDPTLCTHVIYGFAVLGYEGTITAHDSWADYDNRFYERVVAYKKHGIKVSLALGGWNDSAGDKYSKLVNNPSARAKFVTHAVQFLEKYGFDGLDLDWEYPKCWQVDCSKGPDSDKEGFSALVRELSAAFKPKGLLLSSAVSPNKKVIDAGYDVPVLAEHMDWIAVMTYDYHGQWDKKTGHVAPLYYHPEDDTTYFNSNYTMHYWMEMGAPASKLVMGMPLYGQSFTLGTQWDTPPELLAKKNETGLNVPARSGGEAGEFTRAKGFLAYYEICERLKNRAWTVVHDPAGRMGPYAFRGDQWVSFDDVEIIRKKVKFIRSLNLAGGMVWALDLDDFRNRCGEGKHPLLTTIRNGLLEATTKEELIASAALQELPQKPADVQVPQSIEPESESSPPVAPPTVVESSVESSGTSSAVDPPKDSGNSIEVPDNSSEYKVVCYFTNWAWYRPGPGKYTPGDIDPSLCTHIVYAFAVLDRDRLTIKPHDSWADIDNKFYEKVVALRSRGIKVLLGLGGWNDSAGDKYSRLVNSATARRTFLVQAIDFIEQYNFDGLDLDWEYPKCWQVDCNKGPASDKEGFSALVKELRAAFTPKNLLLSAAVSPSKRVIDNGYDVPVLSENLDWIAVMTYDYHGQWDKKTGHVAPMYVRDDDTDKTFNANFTINYWISEGASRRKIVMGFPMYGQSFSLAEGGNKGLDAATYGGGEAGDETRARGFLAFYEICERIRVRGWNVIRDPSGRMGPYATKGDQWVSFDDDFMIHHKAEYVRAMGLGGGMIWALDLDDFNGKYCDCGKSPLLSTINSVLRGREAPPSCSLDGPPEPALEAATTLPTPTAEAPPEQSPSKPEPESPEGNEVSPENESCSGNSFKPDPLDCGKYYLCNNGKYTQLPCPPPLHWNQDRCDWPSKANCPKEKAQIRKADSEEPKEPMIVCYFTNWAFYRTGNGSYSPQEVDASLCTHVIYAWSTLHRDTLTITPRDTNVDIDNDFYGKMSALRLKGVKVLMGVGGWEDSSGDAWSRLVSSSDRREAFIDSVLEFLRRWHFDGIEVSWQYPVCWQASCDEAESHADDRDGFSALMLELSSSLKPRGFLLSVGVAASRAVASLAYHASDIVAAADWLTVAAYDYHGAWELQTAHAAPNTPVTSHDTDNINSSLSYWLEAGVPPSKLVLGVPFYGQSYTLRDAASQGLGAPAAGPGEAGPLTGIPGFLAYHEICNGIRSGLWKETHTPQGSYASRDLQWVSYADEADVWRAVRASVALGARGAAAWALDLDDWRGACGCGPHPLLRALRRTLLDPDAHPTTCRAP